VAAILVGDRGSVAPAIAPACTLLVRPIFSETPASGMPSATADELAVAIHDCVTTGARIINLSVAVTQASGSALRALEAALEEAWRRGALVVAAAGNQGTVGTSALTRHPAVLPVAACDELGHATPETNLARSIGERGLLAPGAGVTSIGGDGKPLIMGGTSVAAAFVSGTAALLWSLFPLASAGDMRRALAGDRPPRRLIPPLLDAWTAHQILSQTGAKTMSESVSQTTATRSEEAPPAASAAAVVKAAGCSCGDGANSGGSEAIKPSPVYAIGSVEVRFPTLGTEKEYAQVVTRGDIKGHTDRKTLAETLAAPHNRYLARQVCWVFTVEGLPTYLLQPRDPNGLDLLIGTLRPAPRPTDVDVVIGWRGPIASPGVCNGLQVPIVAFDQLYSFDVDTLIKAIPGQDGKSDFVQSAEEVFFRIQQLADNGGGLDEHRALNYLAVRYHAIYALAADAFARNAALTSVETRPSRLAGTRRVLDVIFTFTSRATDVSEKHFVRVDVTEEFPFLVSKLATYYDR
jgi:hypothetical protein